MSETTRTFIGIPIPDPVGPRLLRWQEELAPEVPSCRWVPGAIQPFHITLAFLGDVDNRDLNALCLAVAEAAEASDRFGLKAEGLGCFPTPARPRVLWAGITAEDLAPLESLRAAVVEATTRAGYRPDDNRFHPHVTLGRFRPDRGRPPDLTALIRREQARSAGSFPVVEVVAYASTLERGGAAYAPLNRARLKGKKAPGPH